MAMSKEKLTVGGKLHGKIIREVIRLSNGWLLVKTDDSKSPADFKVRTVWSTLSEMRI